MADLIITSLQLENNRPTLVCQAGESVAIGDVCYKSGLLYFKSYNDGTDADQAVVQIMAVTAAALDGYFVGVPAKTQVREAGLFLDDIYVLSDTPGKVSPASDLMAGEFMTVVGFRVSNDIFLFDPLPSGYEHP